MDVGVRDTADPEDRDMDQADRVVLDTDTEDLADSDGDREASDRRRREEEALDLLRRREEDGSDLLRRRCRG